jgi:hypothetical protein
MENCEESAIAFWLMVCIQNTYSEVMRCNPSLSHEDLLLLAKIKEYSLVWFSDLSATSEGQYKILNTFSLCEAEELKDWSCKSGSNKLIIVLRNQSSIQNALKYFWKIILDIYRASDDKDDKTLNPQNYVIDCDEYICLRFEGDFVDSVLLPPLTMGADKDQRIAVYSRFWQLKPPKWYLRSEKRGRFQYRFSPADIIEDDIQEWPTELTADDNMFYLECLRCISIGNGEWKEQDKCFECIFKKNCPNDI